MHWSHAGGAARFTSHERDRRWQRIRSAMERQGIDWLLVFPQWQEADALYIANITGVTLFPLQGEPILVLGGEDSNLAVTREGWIADRRSATASGSTRVPYGEAVASVLRSLSIGSATVGIAGLAGHNYASVRQPEGYLNHTTTLRVLEALPRARVVDGTPVLAEARYVKGPEEIDALRESVLLAERSLQPLVDHGRVGASQAEIFGQILVEQIKGHSDTPMLAWCPGRWGERKHRYTTAPPGELQPETQVVLEIGPSISGYGAQIAQTYFVDQPPRAAVDAFELSKAAFNRALEVMRPGGTWGEVEDQVKAVARGGDLCIDFLVHGRGLGNDGPLLIPTETHARTRQDRLEAYTVFIVKPGAFPTENDPARSHDVRFGDTVLVGPERTERLGTRPQVLLSGSAPGAAPRTR
ncbi:MAG: aminopeptidase P family protein [Chloroflexi bacterium]|nr:aminopeptidase P family protein [Chloroflexota bacterium]MBV9598867.1 aminopeptidase P family protein [Chloroflexota bacterium]